MVITTHSAAHRNAAYVSGILLYASHPIDSSLPLPLPPTDARASEESTSGALAGKVADYLKGTAEEQTSSRDKVLDRLTHIEGKHDAKLHVEAPTEKVDHGKLDQLTHDSSEAFHAPEVENAGKSQADLDAANDKLSSLLDSAADKGSDSSNEKKD